MQQLQKRLTKAQAVCFNLFIPGNKLKYNDNQVDNITGRAVSFEYDKAITLDFLSGRYFTETECENGEQVIILGYDIAKSLFREPQKAVDKYVEAFHRKLRVIGVLAKEGSGMGGGGDADHLITVPLNFMRNMSNIEKTEWGPTILVKGKPDVSADEMEEELEGTLRAIRKLGPGQDDNFALNKITMFTQFLEKVFGQINLYGWIIAGFSILVGGFGIANIMFVSVKERTPIIGIQKSLGAKGYFILIQFLGEAVLLCILGGLIGLLFVVILALLINASTPMHLIITFKNIMLGVGISSLIGIIAGYIPSRQAAKMDPIEAIRYNA
jgi:putative ABC transport system permease protein